MQKRRFLKRKAFLERQKQKQRIIIALEMIKEGYSIPEVAKHSKISKQELEGLLKIKE